MDKTVLDRYEALLSCLDRPAFLVQDGAIILQNSCAAPAEDALRRLLDAGPLCAPSAVTEDCWSFTVRAMDDLYMVQAAHLPQLSAMESAIRSLRVPLTDLFAAVGALMPWLEETENPSLRNRTAELNQGLYRLLRAIDNVGFLAEKELRFQPEPVEFVTFLYHLEQDVKDLCQLAGVRFVLQTSVKTIRISADRQLLERAILNLLSNAIRAARPGSEILLLLSKNKGKAVLEIRNTGEPPENFEDILTYGEPPADRQSGTGLGLLLVRRIVQAHNGVFLFQPREDGASAILSLPVCQDLATTLRSPVQAVDYAGGFNHQLLELSDVLPAEVFGAASID